MIGSHQKRRGFYRGKSKGPGKNSSSAYGKGKSSSPSAPQFIKCYSCGPLGHMSNDPICPNASTSSSTPGKSAGKDMDNRGAPSYRGKAAGGKSPFKGKGNYSNFSKGVGKWGYGLIHVHCQHLPSCLVGWLPVRRLNLRPEGRLHR